MGVEGAASSPMPFVARGLPAAVIGCRHRYGERPPGSVLCGVGVPRRRSAAAIGG
jgi:hypothetical protein